MRPIFHPEFVYTPWSEERRKAARDRALTRLYGSPDNAPTHRLGLTTTMDTYPTADEVARAIVAASAETDADPVEVVTGVLGHRHGQFSVSRARAYAAMALYESFDCGAVAISRMVGSGSPSSHLASLRQQMQQGRTKWFEQAALERVIAAIKGEPAQALPRQCEDNAPADSVAPKPAQIIPVPIQGNTVDPIAALPVVETAPPAAVDKAEAKARAIARSAVHRRGRRFKDRPQEDLATILARSEGVTVKRYPTGAHAGWAPSWMGGE